MSNFLIGSMNSCVPAGMLLLLLSLTAPTWAVNNTNPPPFGCRSWSQIPDGFIEKCALAGGDEIRCSATGVYCCKKDANGQGTTCAENPDDLSRGKGVKMQNAPVKQTMPRTKPVAPTTPATPKKKISTP